MIVAVFRGVFNCFIFNVNEMVMHLQAGGNVKRQPETSTQHRSEEWKNKITGK